MLLCMKLKELRLKNNLTQEQLSRKLNVATHTYIYYETGKKCPSIARLTQIAEIFNVSISFLMDDQNEEVQSTQGKLGAKQLIEEISGLFARRELSEAEKDTVMEALQEAYRVAKEKNKQT